MSLIAYMQELHTYVRSRWPLFPESNAGSLMWEEHVHDIGIPYEKKSLENPNILEDCSKHPQPFLQGVYYLHTYRISITIESQNTHSLSYRQVLPNLVNLWSKDPRKHEIKAEIVCSRIKEPGEICFALIPNIDLVLWLSSSSILRRVIKYFVWNEWSH